MCRVKCVSDLGRQVPPTISAEIDNAVLLLFFYLIGLQIRTERQVPKVWNNAVSDHLLVHMLAHFLIDLQSGHLTKCKHKL